MAGILLATGVVAVAALGLGPAQANTPLTFASCKELRLYLESLEPYTEVQLAPAFYECHEPINLSVDGLTIDFGGSTVRVADDALRPGVLLGDLNTPPARRSRDITVRAQASTPGGGRFVREAVIELDGSPERPFLVHAWRQVPEG